MSDLTPPAEQIGTVDFAAQAAQWIQATSTVYLNLGQEIIVTTEDKIWRILANHLARIENRNAWVTPLGILIAILVVFPTTSFQPFIVSAETWQAIFVISGLLSFGWLVRSLWQSRDSKSVIAFFKSLLQSKGPTIIDDLVAEIKRTAIPSETAGEVIAAQESQVIFRDRFDSFKDWQQYGNGSVSQSKEIPPYFGTFCLKKAGASDPNGGFRELGKHLDLGLVFSGWIYSPEKRAGGKADRLALENSSFDGYGFAVDRNRNRVWIERRENGRPSPISSMISFTPPVGQWYKFQFYVKTGGRLQLNLYSRSGEELLSTGDVRDEKYTSFDRVVVHGGFPYYVDELRITPYQA
jgi:hypothetical protein